MSTDPATLVTPPAPPLADDIAPPPDPPASPPAITVEQMQAALAADPQLIVDVVEMINAKNAEGPLKEAADHADSFAAAAIEDAQMKRAASDASHAVTTAKAAALGAEIAKFVG